MAIGSFQLIAIYAILTIQYAIMEEGILILVYLFIICSIITIICCLNSCVEYCEETGKNNSLTYSSSCKNYVLWKEHGIPLTILIMFFITIWLVAANVAICHNLCRCNGSWIVKLLNNAFIIISTIMCIREIFKELGIKTNS